MKILTISLNAWNDTMATGNTFSNYLSGLHQIDELANIYCRNEPVYNSLCRRYYHVTEKDIIKNIFHKSECGLSYTKDCSSYTPQSESPQSSKFKGLLGNFLRKHRLGTLLFAREALWALNIWQNERLRSFLTEFQPDIIYMHGHNNIYMHKLLWFCKRVTNANVAVFFGDDMYNFKGERFLQKLYHLCLRKQLKYTIENADLILGGSLKLCDEYSAIFQRPFELQIKTCENLEGFELHNNTFPLKIVYAGNLQYGRDKMLESVSDVIRRINDERKYFELHIFTASVVGDNMMAKLNDRSNCYMEGVKPFKEICKILNECDLTLFTESFEDKFKKQTRLSFSTKIIDYFQSNSALLTYGPADVSSIDYLIRSKTSFMANCEEDLFNQMSSIVEYLSTINKMATIKHDYAIKKHSTPTLLPRMRNLVSVSVNKL